MLPGATVLFVDFILENETKKPLCLPVCLPQHCCCQPLLLPAGTASRQRRADRQQRRAAVQLAHAVLLPGAD